MRLFRFKHWPSDALTKSADLILEDCHLDRNVKKNTVQSAMDLYNIARDVSEKSNSFDKATISPSSYLKCLKLFTKVYVSNNARLLNLGSELAKALEKIEEIKSQVSHFRFHGLFLRFPSFL